MAFEFDVFLSHSSADKRTVRSIARALEQQGLRVWLDEVQIPPGASIPAAIEAGLAASRILVLCMSAASFASDWAALESQTFRFRDPLNRDLRFIPLLLDDAPIPGSLAQFKYIDYRDADALQRLAAACRPRQNVAPSSRARHRPRQAMARAHTSAVVAVTVAPDGRKAVTASLDRTARVWDLATGQVDVTLEGHTGAVLGVAVTPDGLRALTASDDRTARVWELSTGRAIRTLRGHTGMVWGTAATPDGRKAVTASADGTARVWDLSTGQLKLTLEGHTGAVLGVAVTPDGRRAVTASADGTARVWELSTGRAIRTLRGHARTVWGVAVTPNGREAVTAGDDGTAQVWDLSTGQVTMALEGHTGPVRGVAVAPDGHQVVTASLDGTLRVWNLATGGSTKVTSGRKAMMLGAAVTASGDVVAASADGILTLWNALAVPSDGPSGRSTNLLYTNAKVVLVGESQAGKSGVALVLAGGAWRPTESTIGAWATHVPLPATDAFGGVEREVWLWDFGGQADQRLIHQLFLKDASLAVLVFDGQREDAVQRIWDWNRAIAPPGEISNTRALPRLLVAARTDVNPVRLGAAEIQSLRGAAGFVDFVETSARTGAGISELREAILAAIDWSVIPQSSSPEVFRRLRRAIIGMKDRGRNLTTVKELLDWLPGEVGPFSPAELDTVIGLLAGPGAVMRLGFDDQVLLQPELLNTYGQAVIRTLAEDPEERGCISEERLLLGELDYPPEFARLSPVEEATVLRGLQRELVSRALCIRDSDPSGNSGTLLVFPSYFRRSRPERPTEPVVFTTYRFEGPLEEIYSTLVVRLHHTTFFTSEALWRDVADLRSQQSGHCVGVQLIKNPDGTGRLDLFADASATDVDRQVLTRFVHDHLLRRGAQVERLRIYVCGTCGTPAKDVELVARRLRSGPKYIVCQGCEKRIDLWDELEREFGSEELRATAIREDQVAQAVIERETRTQTIIADVIATASRARQLARQVSRPWPGVEITFVDDRGAPTVNRVLVRVDPDPLQDTGVIDVDPAWGDSVAPVLYAVRARDEDPPLWMNATEVLRGAASHGTAPVHSTAFKGRRFDLLSVRELREQMLKAPHDQGS